jgi:hypothetical protein
MLSRTKVMNNMKINKNTITLRSLLTEQLKNISNRALALKINKSEATVCITLKRPLKNLNVQTICRYGAALGLKCNLENLFRNE